PPVRRRRRKPQRVHLRSPGSREAVMLLEPNDSNRTWDQALERMPQGLGGRSFGVMPALVTNVRDPDGAGRIEISLPSVFGEDIRLWARQPTLFAGNRRGSWLLP